MITGLLKNNGPGHKFNKMQPELGIVTLSPKVEPGNQVEGIRINTNAVFT
jgi:hypothetical protein